MFSNIREVLVAVSVGLGILLSGGCAATAEKAPEPVAAKPLNNDDYYEAHHEGRVYVFDDAKVYLDFLANGETPYRKARIGAGANGETVVFGLADADKKKLDGIASVDMFDGKLAPAAAFYGEMYREGRIFVFSSFEDMQSVKSTGEAALRYTEIGAGPRGETVIYVLNTTTKKHKPVALIEQFNKLRS